MADFSSFANQVLDLLELSGLALVETHDRHRCAADMRDRALMLRDYLQVTDSENVDAEKVVQNLTFIQAQLDELFQAGRHKADAATSNKKPMLMPTPALH